MNPSVSVIYVNYNTSVLLNDSIRSLQDACKNVSYEIIIVDNASTENEKNMLSKWEGEKDIKLILSDINLGFGKANNLGAKQSSGKYMFFLNPDTLIVNDVLSFFYDFLESADLKTAACGGNLLKADKSPAHSYGNFPGILQELGNAGIGLSVLLGSHYRRNIAIASNIYTDTNLKVPYIVGADLFIKSECFSLVNGFDENFFMYYEETDLFKRLDKEGLESYILPEAKIIHFEGGAVGTNENAFNYKKFEMLLYSKRYYYSKWFSPLKMYVLEIILKTQIVVQYYKGKMGTSIRQLFAIYNQSR